MQTAPQALSEQCVQLKGSLVPMTVMELMDDDREQVESSLMSIISQAPGFFEDTPVIIALEKFNDQNKPINFESLLATCALLRIKPVAVRGGSNLQQMAAIKAGLVLMPAAKSKVTPNGVNQEPPASAAEQPQQNVQNADKKVSLHNRPTDHTADSHVTTSEAKETIITASSQKTEASPPEIPPTLTELEPVPTKVIYNPVRSGQQVYAKGGDLIVLAAVSPGAEILADGNIHVYGPLRGRALAGVKGDIKARIFCQSMEAELVSIAGQYKISEDLQKNGWKTSSQVHLVEDKLTISPLTPQL